MQEMGLKGFGFEVLEAEDGEKGWELFTRFQKQICFIITDLTMPRMNGDQFLKKLREVDRLTPTIIMSAYSCDELQSYSDRYPFVYFFKKPGNAELFLKCIKNAYTDSKK